MLDKTSIPAASSTKESLRMQVRGMNWPEGTMGVESRVPGALQTQQCAQRWPPVSVESFKIAFFTFFC